MRLRGGDDPYKYLPKAKASAEKWDAWAGLIAKWIARDTDEDEYEKEKASQNEQH